MAVREFKFYNFTYYPGDKFPWKEVGCSERRMACLVRSRFIEDLPVSEEEKAEKIAKRKEQYKAKRKAKKAPVKKSWE